MKPLTFGSDPELMLMLVNGRRIVSSIPVIEHDKKDPVDLGAGIKMHADNVLVEATMPPSDTKEQFKRTIGDALGRMSEWLGKDFKLVARASHIYPESELGKKPDVMVGELPVAWEIGCNPSFDAYEEKQKIPEPFKDGLRTGSFHLHLGHELLNSLDAKIKMVKLLDTYVGCASVIFDRDDTSLARRLLYGQAGEFRPTPYGVEWRVLSNYALRSPLCVDLVVDLVNYAFDRILEDDADEVLGDTDFELVKAAINTNNSTLAAMALHAAGVPSSLLKRVSLQYDMDLYQSWRLA